MKRRLMIRISLVAVCCWPLLSAGCGAMRGEGPTEDTSITGVTIDNSSAEAIALSALELLRVSGEKAMPQGSPREASYLSTMSAIVDADTLTAEKKTSRSRQPLKYRVAPGLVEAVIRQWPILMAHYRDGLKPDQSIVQIAVPPLEVTHDTYAVFVPAITAESSVWFGIYCVSVEGSWKIYDFGIYPEPPNAPMELELTPTE